MSIQIKRVYDKTGKAKGFTILVDRIWPRGIKKEDIKIDLWLKEIAPSTELRKWFDHDPDKWAEFKKRYFAEIEKNPETLSRLKKETKKKDVVLLYAAKDTQHNNAAAIKEYLENKK